MEIETTEKNPPRNVARAGMILGGYLSLVHILYMYVLTVPLMSLLFLLGFLGVPYVLYRLMWSLKQSWSQETALPMTYVWAYGAQAFTLASIVLMLPCYYYYRHLLPMQIPIFEQLLQTLTMQSPEMKQQVELFYGGNPGDMLYKLLSEVSVWSYLWTIFSTSIFIGGIMSFVNTLIIKYKSKAK